MNMGAFGENFPYTNFHDLNLDWIIKTFRGVADSLENFDSTSTAALEQLAQESAAATAALNQIVTDAEGDIDEAAQDAIDTMTSLVTNFSIKRRIIFLADSYGGRVDALGRNLGQLIKLNLGLADADYAWSYVPGAAFAHSQESGKYLTQLQNISMDDPDTVTEIVVACGANDANYYTADTTTAIAQFYQYAMQHYRRAKVIIVGAGMTFTPMGLYIKQRATDAFINATRFGCIYPQGCEYVLLNSYLLEDDRVHPNATGVPVLARAITEAITSYSCTTRYMKTFGGSTDPAEQVNPVARLTAIDPATLLMVDPDMSNAKMLSIDGNFSLLMANNRELFTCRFNLNGMVFTANKNVIKVKLTNTLMPGKIIVSGTVNSPNGMGWFVDKDDPSNTCPCLISFTWDDVENEYIMTFLPIGTFTLTQHELLIYGQAYCHM